MRDKLIELLRAGQKKFFLLDFEAKALADYLISHGVTFADVSDNNVGKWISVSERFPKNGEIVLCKASYGMEVLQWDRNANLWLGFSDAHAKWRITHWMPLPEPPKEGE